MAKLHVELVSPEREIWSGEADAMVAKTVEGEIGILPGHAPVLAVLVDGSVVQIKVPGQREWINAMVGSGFFSVAGDQVSVLAEQAELGNEVDVDAAREALQQALAEGDDDEGAAVARRRAAARLRAAGQEV